MQAESLSLEVHQTLMATARGKGSSEPLTVVFADSSYSEVLNNWLRFALPIVKRDLIVFSLDTTIDTTVRHRNISSILLPFDGHLDRLWLLRLQIFEALIASGVDFIHSDADAVWLSDPRRYCSERAVDLAISPGTIWPPEALERWGFVLCCGFFFMRSTEAVAKLLSAVRIAALRDRDDQAALNRVLVRTDIKWQYEDAGYDIENVMGQQFRNYHDVLIGHSTTDFNLDLALLPQNLFQRIPRASKSALVMHPLAPKEPAAKITLMRELGCWRD